MSPTIIYWTDPTSAGGNPCHAKCPDCGETWDIPYLAQVVHQCEPKTPGVVDERESVR